MTPTFCKVKVEVAVKYVMQGWRTANGIEDSHTAKVNRLGRLSHL